MDKLKSIGLIAHDACKKEMAEWAAAHAERLGRHRLFCTGTTGRLIQQLFDDRFPAMKVKVTRLLSGPLGGDQQMGALIAVGELDILFFFTDPMTMQPHNVDVKALIRLSTIHNIVLACNRSTADFVISSNFFDGDYQESRPGYDDYVNRKLG